MRLEDLQEELRRRPFVPFRLFTSDGGSYDVRHPELCMAGRRLAVIGLSRPGDPEPVMERYAVVDLAHVARLGPLDATAGA